jgi:hypothetical protein
MRARLARIAAWAGVTMLLAGCNSGNRVIDPIPCDCYVPPETPINDTVQNTIRRFEVTYEFQDLPKYGNLLASDFRYTFSQASDPVLVQTYGNDWGKDDEVASSWHLFDGFTNSVGEAFPAASKIQMDLFGVQPATDVEHPDSTAYYQKVVVTRVVMSIEIPGSPEPTTYNIDARHEFYLVRGDAAQLDASQEARTDRWYIRRWDDLSAAPATTATFADGPTPTTPKTWGSLKAQYRN